MLRQFLVRVSWSGKSSRYKLIKGSFSKELNQADDKSMYAKEDPWAKENQHSERALWAYPLNADRGVKNSWNLQIPSFLTL